jgi:hypothetical protein
VPRLHQFDAGMGSNVAGAAGDQDFHIDSIVSKLPVSGWGCGVLSCGYLTRGDAS